MVGAMRCACGKNPQVRAEKAEAQIQAVRDVCDEAVRRSRRKSLGYAGIHYVAVEDVRDALGGGAP